MCGLHELIYEVNGMWLLLTDQLAPASKEIVYFQTTVLLVSIIQHPPDDAAALLLDDNVNCEELDHPAGRPSEISVGSTLFRITA